MDLAPVDLAAFFTPADFARGAARLRAEAIAGAVALVLDCALLLALAFSKLARRAWSALTWRCSKPGRPPVAAEAMAGALFAAAIALARAVVSLPADACRLSVLRALEVSRESTATFLGLYARDALLAAFAFALLGAVLPEVRRRWPRRWWLAVGAAGALALVGDAVIEPLRSHMDFKVTRLPDGPLRARLQELLAVHGNGADVVVVDSSRYGTAVNAFTTGFGPTRRLVLTDTLLAMGDEAVAGAVAHEIGHRRDERMPVRLTLSAMGLVAFLWLVDRVLRFARGRGAPSDAAALACVVATINIAALVVQPARAALGREEEREADRLELSVRRDHDAYIADVVARVRSGAGLPQAPAWVHATSDHPDAAERIGRALWYKSRMNAARDSLGDGGP